MKQRGKGDNPLRAAGLVGAMGLDIAICIYLGYLAGSFAGNRFGGQQGWIVGGVLVGLFVGILSCVLLVKKVLGDTDG